MRVYNSNPAKKIILVLFIGIFLSCNWQKNKSKKNVETQKKIKLSGDNCQSRINEGIEGTLIFKSGDFMPSPKTRRGNGKKQGVERIIGIFELTSTKDVKVQNGAFYEGIQTKLIKKISSDKQGCFKAELPAGRYSIFVWENQKWYANRLDDQNNIFPIEVQSGQIINLNFEISYKATY